MSPVNGVRPSRRARFVWVVVPALALAVALWLFVKQPTAPEPEFDRTLITSWSYTLRNTTNRPLENVELFSFVPVDADLGQELAALSTDYPFELTENGRPAALIPVGTIPPYGQRAVRLEADVRLAGVPAVPAHPPQAWLEPSELVESADPEILTLAERLNRGDAFASVRTIYDWLTGNLEYTGYDAVARGASYALKNRKGDCTEFAALAAALARAMNIPARLVSGYVLPENGPLRADEYHAWAEILADDRWVMVDAQKGVFDGSPEQYLITGFEEPARTGDTVWHRFHTETEGLAVTMH